MIDKVLIERKLRNIEEYQRELHAAPVTNYEEFQANIVIKRFIERNIELSIEQMVDVCKHLVSGLDLKEPENYSECFAILAASGVIHTEAAGKFQAMVRFRNLLIHVYDGIDDSITYGIYTRHLEDFTLFNAHIREYLRKQLKT